jgi:hypothetical protein
MSSVSKSLLTATASSRFVEPNYWRDPVSGNGFQIQVEIPQNRIQSAADLERVPVASGAATTLSDVATVANGTMPGMIERYNGQRVVSMTANLEGTTLGQVLPDLRAAIARAGEAPRGVTVAVRGQVPVLEQTLTGLQSGLGLSVLAIVLLLTAYFQSLRLSLAVIAAVPAALAGVVLMLWVTGTSLNVQSVVGATMAVGIGVANAILLVAFSEAARCGHGIDASPDAAQAALRGVSGRLRAVLMTAVGDGRRHGADGAWPRRRRRAGGPPRPRRHRRPGGRYRGDALRGARRVRVAHGARLHRRAVAHFLEWRIPCLSAVVVWSSRGSWPRSCRRWRLPGRRPRPSRRRRWRPRRLPSAWSHCPVS